jgi:hypothetical protein
MSFLQALSDAATHCDDERMRYYGVVAGVVTTLDDAGLGRVKARLRGMDAGTETDWLAPLWPGGIEGIPHKSDPIMVLFEDGNENKGAFLWFPSSKTNNRPNEAVVLGNTFAAMYNGLVAKFNTLLANYQQLYVFVQGHTHASFGTVSADLLEAVIGAGAHNTDTDVGKAQKHDGSVVAGSNGNAKALSGRVKVGI